ncbi:MAG TPA: YfhO family protein [Pyrinomonadaceae bacterium]|nr:YfhO family protein [Pyrinomonadaceae bacterium]
MKSRKSNGKLYLDRLGAKENWAAVALLALLVIVAFANVVFAGKSLVPSENMNPLDWRPTEQNYGPGFVPHEVWARRGLEIAVNYRDPGASTHQMEPAQELLRRSLRRGEFPFWDPYAGGGTPSFASLIPAYLFPPSLAVVLLGNGSLVKNIYILLLTLTAGVLTYFLLRRHGLSWPASIAGAVAFTFSGAVIQTVPSGLGQPVAFFSLPLLVTARLLDRPSARRTAELALAFAFVALASFPPILVQVFGTCVVYLVVALTLRARGTRASALGWFAAGALTSLAVVAVAYLPALPVIADATHIRQYYAHAALDVIRPLSFMQLLSPTIMGGATIYANPPLVSPGGGFLYYVGVIPLLLSGVGALLPAERQARALKITALVAGGVALAKVFGLPPFQWVIHVPVLRNVHYGAYFGIVVAYAIAILAALGFDAFVKRHARGWAIAASGAALAALLIWLRVLAARRGVHLYPEGWRWIADFRVLVLFSCLGVAFGFWATRSTRAARVVVILLLTVLATEGIANSVYPRPRRWNVWQHPPRFVELITERNTGGRVLPLPLYPANTGVVFGHPTIDSLTLFTSPRLFEFYRRYFSSNIGNFLSGTQRIPPERILDAANIEYLAISPAAHTNVAEATRRGYEAMFSDGYIKLFRRATLPRYSLVSGYRIAPNREAALEALNTLPAAEVMLEEAPSFLSNPSAAATAALRVERFSLNEVEIAVDSTAPALLVCSESNMNGWSATVDDRPVPILTANYAFRAVEVPAGSHRIRLRYRPPGLNAGLLISAAGLMGCLYGLRRKPPAPLSPES